MRELVSSSIGSVRFDLGKTLWLWGLMPAAIVGVVVVTPQLAAISVALTVWCLCLGHSVGLHRGVIHRSWRGPRVVELLMFEGFALTGLGGPLSWVRLHADRDYWQNQSDCPDLFAYRHGLLRDFWWNLHLRFVAADDRSLVRLPPGALNDPYLRFLEKTWPLHTLALAVVLLVTLGADAVAVVVGTRVVVGIIGHWFVGYAAHVWGDLDHVVRGASESGRNIWLLGVVSFGEGFHNNHHAFGGSARMGLRWWQLDVGYLLLRGLGALGLARDIAVAVVDDDDDSAAAFVVFHRSSPSALSAASAFPSRA